jgi:hypothetical protein
MVKHTPRWLRAVALMSACATLFPACADYTSSEDEDEGDDTGEGDSGEDSGGVVIEDGRLFINEFMASNGSTELDGVEDDASPDWLEIYNAGTFDVSLAGFWITDDLDEPAKVVLGDLVVPALGHLVLIADAEDGAQHLPFKLDADGDALGLFDPEGQPLDRITFGGQVSDVSSGRAPDGGELGILPEPTPGEANPTEFR